jgi:F-type H+-transporting ATPase subunit delta
MSVRGVSRTSLTSLTEQLEAESITSATEATRLGDELFAVVGLLDTEHGLRRALSDPGKPAAEKGAVASALLHGKVTARTEALVVAAVGSRWATSGDMVDAIEQLAVEALVLAAQAEDGLDDLEDGLFRFGRVVAAQPELRAALASTWLPAERKDELLDALLRGKVTAVTLRLITQMVTHPRGRALPEALDMCSSIAARRRQQLIAVVRSAVELTAAQQRRLADALAATYGHPVHLNVVIDPSVLGGISVQIGDELIDGTAARSLAAVRRKLAG